MAAASTGSTRSTGLVTVSSTRHRIRAAIHFDDLQCERSYSPAAAYGQPKLANLMFTYELRRRLATHGTTVAVAAHPGMSSTELARNTPAALRLPLTWLAPLITQTPAMARCRRCAPPPTPPRSAASTTVPADATRSWDPRLVTSSPESYEAAVQQRLWAVSENLTGVKFPVVQSKQNSFPSGSAITM